MNNTKEAHERVSAAMPGYKVHQAGHRVRLPSVEWSGKAQIDYIFLDKACTVKLDKMSHQLPFLHKNVSKNCFPRQIHKKHKK